MGRRIFIKLGEFAATGLLLKQEAKRRKDSKI